MPNFVPFNREQSFLLPPDLKEWLPSDDVSHFIVAAVDHVPLASFQGPDCSGGKRQYHPRLMLALLIYRYAYSVFSSGRIERASFRDIGMRFVAANPHPDHDTITVLWRNNRAAFEAAFPQALLRASALVHLGTVPIDDIKIDANIWKSRSVHYDWVQELRARLASDIADLTAKAEATDADDTNLQALPVEQARRETPKVKLDAACARLEAEAARSAYDAKIGHRGTAPVSPDPNRAAERQSNPTDPDSSLMLRSERHEYRQAYNAQALVCTEGTQLVLATNLAATTADAPSFAATILAMEDTIGLPRIMLANTGYANGPAIGALQAQTIEPLVAIVWTRPYRPYDFRPRPHVKPSRLITEPWRIAMKAKSETEEGRKRYGKREQSVEPAFGIIKSAIGFVDFHLRGITTVASERILITLAYTCRRLSRLQAAWPQPRALPQLTVS